MVNMIKFLFYLEPEMREWLEAEATSHGISMAQVLRNLMAVS